MILISRLHMVAFVMIGLGLGAVAALAFMLPSPAADFSESWINAFNSIFAALLSGGVAFLSAYWLWRREMAAEEAKRRSAQHELGRTAGMMIATPLAGLALILNLVEEHGVLNADHSYDFAQVETKTLRAYLDGLKGAAEDSKINLERLSSNFNAMEGERIMWFTYAELQIAECLSFSQAGDIIGGSVDSKAKTVILNGHFVSHAQGLLARLAAAHRELSSQTPDLNAMTEFQGDDIQFLADNR